MKPDNAYELRFANLKIGAHRYSWEINASFFEEREVEDFSDVHVDVSLALERKERLMNLTFDLNGSLKTTCDRCGEDVEVTFNQENHLVIRMSHETDLTDDEVVFIDENEQSIDLGQFIYEFVMVGLPSRFLHAEGECDPEVVEYLEERDQEGNENGEEKKIDPRWEALKKLKS